MNDTEFDYWVQKIQAIYDKWAAVLGLDFWDVRITYERQYDAGRMHTLGLTQADWQYRQAYISFFLPGIKKELSEDQLSNLVLHEISHILIRSAYPDEGYNDKVEFATETVARAIEDAYKAGQRGKVNNKESCMSQSEKALEQQIKEKGLTAPRVTPEDIDAKIVDEKYHVFEGTTVTVCALTLKNGFVVVGEGAAASPENFDEEIGRKIARDNARNKIWALEGYLLRESLSKKEESNV